MSWQNPITYVGTARDKAQQWRYRRRGWSDILLEDFADAYCHDDIVFSIATRAPQEMLSRGYEIWQGEDRRKDLETALGPDGINLDESLLQALTWERLLGGSALLVGAEDGRPLSEPLQERDVSDLHFAPDTERRDIQGNIQRDSVLRLRFFAGSLAVHRSRLILFTGAPCPRQESADRQGWGIGEVEYAWDEIKAFNSAWADFRALLPDGNQSVLKLKGLLGLLTNEDGQRNLQDRVAEIDMHRSILRSLVLDADGESFERVSTNMAGYSDAIDKSFERLAMATRTPLTILVGTPPKGLNATGESDLTIYYDRIARERKPAERAILRIARIQAIALDTNPEGLRVEWPPFWQPTETEKAAVAQSKATATAAVIANAQAALGAAAISEAEFRALVRGALELEN
jgi:phage-related protein (TIGR01555 family)